MNDPIRVCARGLVQLCPLLVILIPGIALAAPTIDRGTYHGGENGDFGWATYYGGTSSESPYLSIAPGPGDLDPLPGIFPNDPERPDVDELADDHRSEQGCHITRQSAPVGALYVTMIVLLALRRRRY